MTPIVTLLLCHYKKEVVATLEGYLNQQSRIEFRFLIFSLWIIQVLLRRLFIEDLRAWRQSVEDFSINYIGFIFSFTLQYLLLILWIVLSKAWVAKFL